MERCAAPSFRADMTSKLDYPGLRPLPRLIFGSRWLQLPLYLGLIVPKACTFVLFRKSCGTSLRLATIGEQQIMLIVLD